MFGRPPRRGGWAGLGWLAGWLCFPSLLEPSDWVEEKREGRKRFSTLLKKLFSPSSSYLILHVPFRGACSLWNAWRGCDAMGGEGGDTCSNGRPALAARAARAGAGDDAGGA